MLYRVVSDSRKAALAGSPAEALHDLRVGARRFRAALRFFRALPPAARRLDRELARLSNRLSPMRDFEVWASFLKSPQVRDRLRGSPGCRAFRERALAQVARQKLAMQRILRGQSCLKGLQHMAHFVRIEMPQAAAAQPDARPFAPDAAKRMRETYARIADRRSLSRDASPEEVHALRKRVRRARYCAEFGAPVLGSVARKLAARFKDLADTQGDWHDADMHLAMLEMEPDAAAASLRRLLNERRRTAWRHYRKAWKALCKQKLRRQVEDLL